MKAMISSVIVNKVGRVKLVKKLIIAVLSPVRIMVVVAMEMVSSNVNARISLKDQLVPSLVSIIHIYILSWMDKHG